jgi:SAM-dependent methyltransferase
MGKSMPTSQLPLFEGDACDCTLDVLRAALPVLADLPSSDLTVSEQELLRQVRLAGKPAVGHFVDSSVLDPWTAALAAARNTAERRDLGQFFTPWPIVHTMVDWVRAQRPQRIVDIGCGTGRFALAAAKAMPDAVVWAVDSDPVATLLCRAHARRLRLSNLSVRCQDYLQTPLPSHGGRTAFIGNPPYVRHHRLRQETKTWGGRQCVALGLPFSGLAGLHAYFFLATALHAAEGDVGCFITSAEWLDVNYGALVRRLLLERLGALSLTVLDPQSAAFDDAMTSAAITCFRVGHDVDSVRYSSVSSFLTAQGPSDAMLVPRARLEEGTWGFLRSPGGADAASSGGTALGELFQVRRGIATGDNGFFVMSWTEARHRGLVSLARPVISSGREILDSGGTIGAETRNCIVMLPRSFEDLPAPVAQAAQRFVAEGEGRNVHRRYLCAHRNPWWWLGSPRPAPIVVSYMARRPPVFALNPSGVLLANIAHGLFPRRNLNTVQLNALAGALNGYASHFVGGGRSYQGGLEKFEPGEVERLLLPQQSVARALRAILPEPLERHAHAIAATA